ncbi:MAG: bifunctional phosphopantothenoylcysteine decarboxylase/phosphopantothenate--cysteine ligase CoaBC [Acidobacteriota bacterium]|nr:MAG: bifunctional phosphopantothenoylcysteine decarboxylase/phosphopantothenate--cysteine ligase CoaBC [Acidobacteriota bacterium]
MPRPKILLGVTGGIAAYKSAELVRELSKRGAEVKVVLTARARAFVSPLTLATLSAHPVYETEFPTPPSPEIGHIELARWADTIVVAPATANTLSRFARGLADDLLSTVYLAFDGPVVVAPAMNPRMWDHVETRETMARLAHRGAVVVEPEEGLMACGEEGAGRLASLHKIADEAMVAARRSNSMAGQTALVTAGPTYEPLDPVRFVGNRSSGKMGYAVAAAARARGAEVILISGPTAISPPWGVELIQIETAEQMHAACLTHAARASLIVMCAAVADHRPAQPSLNKIDRKGAAWRLELVATTDILSDLVRARRPWQFIVGFAAETGDALARGREKRARKGCDLIVINDVAAEGSGFATDTNQVIVVDADDAAESWPLLAKREVAERLLDRIEHARSRTSA